MAMVYRVNAGAIPRESWIQDQDFGGGRVIGEVCHFVDFLTYINGSLLASVHAHVLNDPDHLNDTLTVSLSYLNGSIGTISYFTNGDKSLPKERVEVFAHGRTVVLEDFKRLTIHAKGKQGYVVEMLTFGNLRNKGTTPQRRKEKRIKAKGE